MSFFTTMDGLNANNSNLCNFSLLGGKSIGTYPFKAGFYGLTIMTAEFKHVMDAILAEFPCSHAFIDVILVIPKVPKMCISRWPKKS